MIRCHNKKLEIDFTEPFGFNCKVFITPWGEGIKWVNQIDGKIETHPASKELGIVFKKMVANTKGTPWLNSFPPKIVNKVVEFEKKYSFVSYSLLWHISHSINALELFINQPKLTWLLLSTAQKKHWSNDDVASIFKLKQVEIFALCGYTKSKSLLKVFNKVSFNQYEWVEWYWYKNYLNLCPLANIGHFKYLTPTMLKSLTTYPDLISYNIFKNMNDERDVKEAVSLILDINRMGNIVEEDNNGAKKCKTLHQVRQLHDRMVIKMMADPIFNEREVRRQFSSKVKNKYDESPYKKPPIQGNRYIKPILNITELRREGARLSHCVASYHNDIKEGKVYIYRMVYPERLTISINCLNTKNLKIGEVRGYHNAKPSVKAMRSINTWLLENK